MVLPGLTVQEGPEAKGDPPTGVRYQSKLQLAGEVAVNTTDPPGQIVAEEGVIVGATGKGLILNI